MADDVTNAILVRLAGDALLGLHRHAPGFEARLTRDTWLIASGEAHSLLNWVAVFAPGPAAEIALRDHVAWLRARGLPALVFVAPDAGDSVTSLCRTIGLVATEPVPLMVCRLATLPPRPVDGITIAPIRDAAALRSAVGLLAAAFGIAPEASAGAMRSELLHEPALTLDAARQDGAVVSVAATSRAGNLVYLDLMATAPAYRRRGIGTALLAHVLARHAATGATHAFLVATEDGRRLYERLGFRIRFEATVWEVPPSLAGKE